MAAGDVTAHPSSESALRLHPHLVALIKWCASCLWGAAASVRRLLALPPSVPPLPPLAALIRSTLQRRAALRARAASAARAPHISAHATVECVVLRAPPPPLRAAVDVIFVHGLYGSLENTWRQGQWMSRRKLELKHIPLKRPAPEPSAPCSCAPRELSSSSNTKRPRKDQTCLCTNENRELVNNILELNTALDCYKDSAAEPTDCKKDLLRIDLLNETINDKIDSKKLELQNKYILSHNINEVQNQSANEQTYFNSLYNRREDEYIVSNVDIAESYGNFVSEMYINNTDCFGKGCDNLDVIIPSINEEGKQLDNKNTDEICDMSTSEINKSTNYVRAEAKKNIDQIKDENLENSCTYSELNSDLRHTYMKDENSAIGTNRDGRVRSCEVGCGCVCSRCYSSCWPRDWLEADYPDARVISINYTSDPYLWRPIWIKESKRLRLHERAEQMAQQLLALGVGSRPIVWVGHSKGGLFIKQIYTEAYEAYIKRSASGGMKEPCLWSRTAGFMFYSVPHRGSPLADINIPPLVARSVELLEMGKDCSEVLGLQQRWLRAASGDRGGGGGGGGPVVRSLVETCRTLMAVLWLRIVSVESADAGIGALCGVSVDHREICKPSGRGCLLYRELLHVLDSALGRAGPPPPAPRPST